MLSRPPQTGSLVSFLIFIKAAGGPELHFCGIAFAYRGGRNFNNLQFTLGRESLKIGGFDLRDAVKSVAALCGGICCRSGLSNGVIGSVRRRLNHDELALPSVCLWSWRGVDKPARGSDGVLGCRRFGVTCVVPVSRDGRAESRALVGEFV